MNETNLIKKCIRRWKNEIILNMHNLLFVCKQKLQSTTTSRTMWMVDLKGYLLSWTSPGLTSSFAAADIQTVRRRQ